MIIICNYILTGVYNKQYFSEFHIFDLGVQLQTKARKTP